MTAELIRYGLQRLGGRLRKWWDSLGLGKETADTRRQRRQMTREEVDKLIHDWESRV